MQRHIAIVLCLVGCERAGDESAVPALVAPEAPEVEAIRSSTAEHDPPPPAAAPIVRVASSNMQWFLALTPQKRHVVRSICRARAADPCWGLVPIKTEDNVDSFAMAYRGLDETEREPTDEFCARANRGRPGCSTPLVVAFDGQPIEFAQSTSRFAFTPGEPVASDWPTAETPWIAIDRDGDGAITSGAELFGDATVLPSGGVAKNGYAALATLDDNRDGVIDRRDIAFDRLLLWADRDGDRKSSPPELRALADVVVEIPLANSVTKRCTRGNCEGERGALTWRDGRGGHTGAVVDVYLTTAR